MPLRIILCHFHQSKADSAVFYQRSLNEGIDLVLIQEPWTDTVKIRWLADER